MRLVKTGLTAVLLGTCLVSSVVAAPVAGDIKPNSLKGKNITFVSFGGLYQEGQLAALKEFQDKTGAKILSEGPTEIAKLKAQVDANRVQWDIVDVGDMAPHIYCGKYFEKLDFSRIDTSKIPPGQISDCSVPAMNYGILFLYQNDKFKTNAPKSWGDFFDVKKFPGTRAINNDPSFDPGFLEQAMIAAGADRAHFTTADIEKGIDFLRDRREHIIFWQSGAQAQQMLESGEADLIMAWNGRAMAATNNGANYTPVWNDWLVVMDHLTIARGSKNLDAAYDLINAYLGQQAQEVLTEKTSYSPINVDARPQVPEKNRPWLVNTPERQAQGYSYNAKFWSDNYELASELWAGFITGY